MTEMQLYGGTDALNSWWQQNKFLRIPRFHQIVRQIKSREIVSFRFFLIVKTAVVTCHSSTTYVRTVNGPEMVERGT